MYISIVWVPQKEAIKTGSGT